MAKNGHAALVIKGSPKAAKRAAARHGLNPGSCVAKGAETQCYIACTPSTNKRVLAWFDARNRTKSKRGLPPGTLLFHGSCSTAFGRRRRRK